MADNNNVFVPIELPPEIMAQMPPDLTLMEKREWRKKKAAELQAQQEQETAAQVQSEDSESVSDDSSLLAENAETDEVSVSKSAKQSRSQEQKTSQKRQRGAIKASFDNRDSTTVRGIPKNIFIELRHYFPKAERNSDMIAAVAYIFTHGACDIPPEAMELVKAYDSDNAIFDLSEQMARMNQAIRSLDERTSAIELCSCYNLYDRRYGAKERRKSPRENEFREQGALDMLHRLRIQAKDQRREDDIERGRSIYEQTKDKNDKND